MIDVHLLTFDELDEWRRQCLESLKGAPIALHELPAVEGHLGLGRAKGFTYGSHPFVASVDPDDWYSAAAFTELAKALNSEEDASLAYTDYKVVSVDGSEVATYNVPYNQECHRTDPAFMRGLVVMRRAFVADALETVKKIETFADWVLTWLVAQRGKVLHVPIIGRYVRVRPDSFGRRGDQEARRLMNSFSEKT